MPLSYKQLHKLLSSLEYTAASQKGSHIKYRKGADSVLVPKHKELKKGTASSILKDIAQQNNTTLEQLKINRKIKV